MSVHLNTALREAVRIREITCFKDTVNTPFSIKVTNLLPGSISKRNFFIFYWHNSPLVGQGLLIVEASRSHSDTPQKVGLLWTSDHRMQRPLPDNTQHSQERDFHTLRRDSNPQSQQARGRRPLGLALAIIPKDK